MFDKLNPVIEEIDLLVTERKELVAIGPHLKIVHRFGQGTECQPGEEISWALLLYRSREYLLPLSTSLLPLFDYLARHRRLPQSAAQIVAGMRADAFYVEHRKNMKIDRKKMRMISRRSETNEVRYRLRATVQWVHIE